jgi:nucleotide-binding universal stress UspA family protein
MAVPPAASSLSLRNGPLPVRPAWPGTAALFHTTPAVPPGLRVLFAQGGIGNVGEINVCLPKKRPRHLVFSWDVSPLPANQRIERTPTKHVLRQTVARPKAKAAGLLLDTELVDGNEVERIIEYAKKNHADLLVVSLRQDTLLIGQPAREIAARSPCALLGVR